MVASLESAIKVELVSTCDCVVCIIAIYFATFFIVKCTYPRIIQFSGHSGTVGVVKVP